MTDCALGVDLGGSSVKVVAVNRHGEILSRRNVEFDPEQQLDWAETIRNLVQTSPTELGIAATRIGLSAPGLAARDGRSIAYMPGRLHGLEGLDWTEYLQASSPIPVLNDAHAALAGESWLGAAAGMQNAVMLTLGTGVGGAALVDGRLLRGQIGRAGHLGHMCLNPDGPLDITNVPGSLELLIGNCTIQERSGSRFETTHDLVAAVMAGNAEANAIWLNSVKALACAITSLINIFDPEAVIIGGGIARADEALFRPLREHLDRIEWRPGGHRVQILAAKLGELAGAIGAAAQAFRACE